MLCSVTRDTLENSYVSPESVFNNSDEAQELNVDGPMNNDPETEDNGNSGLSQYEVAVEQYSISATTWKEGMVETPSIGGVSLGKIPLILEDCNNGVSLKNARDNMLFQSGQAYIPLFKRMSCKTGMRNIKKLGAFPGMVTNLLLPNCCLSSSLEEKHAVDAMVRELSNVKETIVEENKITQGNNCCRLEFYYQSHLSCPEPDWAFPLIDLWDYVHVSEDNAYFKAYSSMMGEVLHCLTKTFLDHKDTTNFDTVPLPAKQMIVLCAEMAVSMTEFPRFSPKCMKLVTEERSHITLGVNETDSDLVLKYPLDKYSTLWFVPEEFLEKTDEATERMTGLKNGLTMRLLPIPTWHSRLNERRLSEDDLSR